MAETSPEELYLCEVGDTVVAVVVVVVVVLLVAVGAAVLAAFE